MAWLTTNAFPESWYNIPLFQWADRPQWFVTDTGTYAPGGTPNPYALAVTGGPGVGEWRNALLCTNRYTSSGAAFTFKLYVPSTTGELYVKNAVNGSQLVVSGFSPTVGWKDISVAVPDGDTALVIDISDPGFSNGTYPKYVVDEVSLPAVKDGGAPLEFPPAMQMPVGWTTSGTRTFAPSIAPSGAHTSESYGSYGVVSTRLLGAGETAELLTTTVVVPVDGRRVKAKLSLGYVSGADPDAAFYAIRCDAAGVEVEQIGFGTYLHSPHLLSVVIPEGTWRIKFKAVLNNATQVDAYIDAVEPVSLWGEEVPFVPPIPVGWLAQAELPRGWFNYPISQGYVGSADDPQPQWSLTGAGPYAIQVVGEASMQGATARIATNKFIVPAGGSVVTMRFYNTSIFDDISEDVNAISFYNRGNGNFRDFNQSLIYSVDNFDPTKTGWQDIQIPLTEGVHCIEIHISRFSWRSPTTLFIIDGVTSPLIANGGDGIDFPYGCVMPPGWVNSGQVPFALTHEQGYFLKNELTTFTGTYGVPGVSAGDCAELLTHVFTVAEENFTGSIEAYADYQYPFNPTLTIILCDESGEEVSTLSSIFLESYYSVTPEFSIPIGIWSLRFRLTGDFSQPSSFAYIDSLTPALLARGGDPVQSNKILMNMISSATMSNASQMSALLSWASLNGVIGVDDVIAYSQLFATEMESACVLASSMSGMETKFLWLSSSAEAVSSFSTTAEIAIDLQSMIAGQDWMPFPSKDSTTWVLNAESSSSTRYDAYDFNSFAEIGGVYYGCRDDGVYALDGDDDAGSPIQAMLSFGKRDFGTSALKRITNAYVGVSSTGKLVLKIIAEGDEYHYVARDSGEHLQVQRFDTGKGLRVNYLEFDLYNQYGDDFDLSSIEFAVVPTARRI